jgi:hypothetical protein
VSILIANYRGISAVSDGIRLLTYSCYSHSAAYFDKDIEIQLNGNSHFLAAGTTIEAWSGGVKLAKSLSENHTERTQVDLFETKRTLTHLEEQTIGAFLIRNIGKKYAYGNVARFVPIVRLVIPKPLPYNYDRTHVFCSELVMLAFREAGINLLERCEPWEIPPRDVPRSPLLYFKKTVFTS